MIILIHRLTTHGLHSAKINVGGHQMMSDRKVSRPRIALQELRKTTKVCQNILLPGRKHDLKPLEYVAGRLYTMNIFTS
jgi:hypothetical protein